MIKYSVVVPSYNSGRTIRECLSSLLLQSLSREDYEVIVVDDGSVDNTSGIIKEFPVKYLWQPNNGPASARNHGAREAKGEIILFTDSDCVPAHDWIEEMVKPLQLSETIAVKGAYRTCQKSLTARFAQMEFQERFEMLMKAESIDMVDTYSAAFRRDVFMQQGGFDESFPFANNEDTDLSYKLSMTGRRMVFNPNAVVFHLRHPDTPVKYFIQKFWRGYWRMVVYKRFPEKMLKDTYTPQSLKIQIVSLLGFLIVLLLASLHKNLLYAAVVFPAIFIVSSAPFLVLSVKKDFSVGMFSLFFLAIRALSIGSGIIYYFYFQTKKTIFKNHQNGLKSG